MKNENDFDANQLSFYLLKVKQFCRRQSDCLGCSLFDAKLGCRLQQKAPAYWDIAEHDIDIWRTDEFKAGWKEGYSMGKQDLSKAIMKTLEVNRKKGDTA